MPHQSPVQKNSGLNMTLGKNGKGFFKPQPLPNGFEMTLGHNGQGFSEHNQRKQQEYEQIKSQKPIKPQEPKGASLRKTLQTANNLFSQPRSRQLQQLQQVPLKSYKSPVLINKKNPVVGVFLGN